MTISIWRYSHLMLAVSSFLFLALAAITGVILAFDAINAKLPSYRVAEMDYLRLSETMPVLQRTYPEIIQLSVDKNQFVRLEGSDSAGNAIDAYIDPATGKVLGLPQKKTAFILWVTALHRSLFLHNLGRLFVGMSAVFLTLLTASGLVLLIQRQHGLQHFFDRIIKENFAQYWHVMLGRLSLMPVLIIALTGTYLSLVTLGVVHENRGAPQTPPVNAKVQSIQRSPGQFKVFRQILLSDLQSMEFPFADDPEEYYTLKLKDKEIVVNQFSGEILSELHYPFVTSVTQLSLNLHTGQTSVIWAVILALSSLNILFFIYSGFAITLKRRAGRVKNKFGIKDSQYIVLVGSENGSTFRFATEVHQQLLAHGLTSHLAELNDYAVFPKAEHLLLFTATHGLGDAPSNAGKFTMLLQQQPQRHAIQISVIGFGSRSYPDFCGYAYQLHDAIQLQSWAMPILEPYTVNDKSVEEFESWAKAWSEKAGIPLLISSAFLNTKPGGLKAMTVIEKTAVANTDQIFTVRLRPSRLCRFSSGDLLAIYPHDNAKERIYSIGKINRDIQLIVKLYPEGAGSGYLHQLGIGQVIKTRLIKNEAFHFPKEAPLVVLLANGTGVAPFLGMINENAGKVETHLYAGFRTSNSLAATHVSDLQFALAQGKLNSLHLITSKEGTRQRITHLIREDAEFFALVLRKGGTIMICGSLPMQNDVLTLLSMASLKSTGLPLTHYQNQGQILTDCY
jgi:sulfite reductase (NADPH) flavoprotein alpha-component